ncbi:MAG: hypothetical protein LPD71_04130, partial [Shewanella sp.]|nr:hypothetical protein [Shewanella sp.]
MNDFSSIALYGQTLSVARKKAADKSDSGCGLGKVRINPRTALADRQIPVQGIQLQQGGLPFKAQYHSNRVCPKSPKGEADSPICFVTALANDSG